MAREPSDLEATFATLWRQLDGPELTPEYQFMPPRKWRFDFAHIHARIAIELDGGTWPTRDKTTGKLQPGRHITGKGYRDDCIKRNAATARGWLVFNITSDMLTDDPVAHLDQIIFKIKDVIDDGIEA